jgi:hypothetical protein
MVVVTDISLISDRAVTAAEKEKFRTEIRAKALAVRKKGAVESEKVVKRRLVKMELAATEVMTYRLGKGKLWYNCWEILTTEEKAAARALMRAEALAARAEALAARGSPWRHGERHGERKRGQTATSRNGASRHRLGGDDIPAGRRLCLVRLVGDSHYGREGCSLVAGTLGGAKESRGLLSTRQSRAGKQSRRDGSSPERTVQYRAMQCVLLRLDCLDRA